MPGLCGGWGWCLQRRCSSGVTSYGKPFLTSSTSHPLPTVVEGAVHSLVSLWPWQNFTLAYCPYLFTHLSPPYKMGFPRKQAFHWFLFIFIIVLTTNASLVYPCRPLMHVCLIIRWTDSLYIHINSHTKLIIQSVAYDLGCRKKGWVRKIFKRKK